MHVFIILKDGREVLLSTLFLNVSDSFYCLKKSLLYIINPVPYSCFRIVTHH